MSYVCPRGWRTELPVPPMTASGVRGGRAAALLPVLAEDNIDTARLAEVVDRRRERADARAAVPELFAALPSASAA